MSDEDDASGGRADEAYLMPAYVKLLVSDAARARAFYVALGFEVRHGDQVFTHLRWARGADLFLVAPPPGVAFTAPRGAGVLVCYAVVDDDLDAIAVRARAAGAKVDGPAVQPWHTRVLVVTDHDCFRLAFVQPA
jgi:catechol 2,3-dioxygenase-like lactoylglutathione lyase family enzyme